MAIGITQLAGGKTTSRIIYMEYNDTGGPGGYAKLEWLVAATKPTLITTTTSENILDIIQAANLSMDVMYVGLMGATDYGSCYFGFWDDTAEESWIAEIGCSYAIWTFLRLISAYKYQESSENRLKYILNIDTCEDNVYMVTPNTAVVSTNRSDDFTGSNGDPPNSVKWEIISGVPEIQNNKLELTQIGTAGIPDVVMSRGDLSAGYGHKGSAEATVDFELINYASVESWCAGIFQYNEGGNLRSYIGIGWLSGQYQYQFKFWDSGASVWRTSEIGVGGVPISGKLKLEVYWDGDEHVYGYYWDGADWVLVGDSTPPSGISFYPGDYMNFRLRVDNLTPSSNITWRADNFIMRIGNGNHCTISIYEKDSYNSTTKKFETRTTYKDTDRYYTDWPEVYPIAAGTGGCAVQTWKQGFYWYDQAYGLYSDLVTYDDNLDLVSQTNYGAEYVLGEHCSWQRDITDGFEWLDALNVELMCGNYPDYLFIVGTSLFLDGDTNSYQGLVEIDAVTLIPLRFCLLQTTDNTFDGSEIQDAIAVP